MKIEKMQTIFETVLVENISNCCGNSIDEIFEYLASLGFSKKEAFEFVEKNYLDGINWQCDDEEDSESPKLVPVPDYFRFIEMLDKVKAPYTNYKKEKMIEIKKDYTAVDFLFDENFNLIEVAF